MDVSGDLLSDLPQCIIENILIRMPIIDAVKTCLLSSKWRYMWTTIPSLVFDENTMRILEKKNSCKCMTGWEGIAKFITYTLFLHQGPIHRFELSVSCIQSSWSIDQWILNLSRNRGVKELIIGMSKDKYWRAPSCLFKLDKLTHLELRNCNVNPPSDFQGFSFLKILSLYDIDGPPEAIEFLISRSPLLETLSVSCTCRSKLHIDAPRLKSMNLYGELQDIILVNTPLLLSADITILSLFDDIEHRELNNQSTFDKFIGAMPLIETLIGDVFFAKYLSIGNEFARFPITCNHLAIIELHCISFEDIEEMNVVVRLLVCSPILRTLIITVYHLDKELDQDPVVNWDKDSLPNCNLEHLQQVRIDDMLGKPNEFILVEFLLKQSPVLDTLGITTSASLKSAERDKVLVELLGFQRASAHAKIMVV